MHSLSTRKKLCFSVAVLIVTSVAALTTSEILLWRRYGQVSRITGVTDWQLEDWEGLTYYWDKYHARFGWTNVPGYHSDERVPFRVTINEQGLRDTRSFTPQAPAGVRRIAIFGDSCVFGEEVDDHQSLPAQLESQLEHVQVLNYGVHGYGLGQMMLRLEDEGFALAPNHVVCVLMLPADIFRDAQHNFVHNKPRFTSRGSELVIENNPVPRTPLQPWMIRNSFTAAWLFGRPFETSANHDLETNLRTTQLLLNRMQAACRQQDVSFTVVLISAPTILQSMWTQRPVRNTVDQLRKSFKSMEVDVVDLVDKLNTLLYDAGDVVCAPQGHWSALGNCQVASLLTEQLTDRYPESYRRSNQPPCWGPSATGDSSAPTKAAP